MYITGNPASQIGILVEIENSALSDDLTQIVEKTALRSINYIPGIKAYEKEGAFYLQAVSDVSEFSLTANVLVRLYTMASACNIQGLRK